LKPAPPFFLNFQTLGFLFPGRVLVLIFSSPLYSIIYCITVVVVVVVVIGGVKFGCDTWCSATAFPYRIGFSGFVTSTFICVVVVVIEPCLSVFVVCCSSPWHFLKVLQVEGSLRLSKSVINLCLCCQFLHILLA
jgi:hypothetical protein